MNKALIQRPIAVSMCIIALVVMGWLALTRIPVSLMPDIDIPQITVQASMPGYSAQEIEKEVLSPLRGRLMQVAGVTDLRSEARMDAGHIKMTFEPGSRMDLLFIEVNEKVDRAMNQMPKDMERPKIMKAGAMDIPAFFLDMTPANPSKFAEMSRFAKNVVVKRIEQLPQTAIVDISGTAGTEIECIPDERKLRAMGITTDDIENAIRRNDITLAALSVTDGLYRYNIHFDSQLLTQQDIEEIYINHEGRLIQLKDICDIREHTAERNGYVKHNGKEAVTMAIIKQNDARMEDLRKSMETLLKDLEREYPDIRFELTRDQTLLLQYTIDNLKENLYTGALMACLVLFVFLKKWRLSLLVVLSIPLSFIITILCFHLLGISMNVISLSGLILGTGMIVDNAIIVVDNITARREKDKTRALVPCTVKAVREVFAPMLSSVLTTCSVFLPLIFLSGTTGALFYDHAVSVSVSLFASLLVAVVVVPVYYVVLYRNKAMGKKETGKADLGIRIYERIMKWTLRHWVVCLCLFFGCIPATALLAYHIEKERMPDTAQDDCLLTIDWNSNISAEENDRRTTELMEEIKEEVSSATCMTGVQKFMLPHTKDITASETVIYIKSKSTEQLEDAQEKAISFLQQNYPQAAAEYAETGNLYNLIFSTDEPDLEIHLQDKNGKRPAVGSARAFRDTLLRRFPMTDIPNIMTETNIQYVADTEQMAVYKISYETLYKRLKELTKRNQVLHINEGAEPIPVLVGTEESAAKSILNETVRNSDGTDIPIAYLIRESKGEDYKRLQAGNSGEFYSLDMDGKDRDIERIMEFVNEYVRKPDNNYSANFSGGYFSSRKLIGELSVVLTVALALLYFILAAQFESLVQPLIILLEMVADVFFVMLGLWLTGESLNVMSMTGIVVMSGIIINDSILKIDTINHSKHLERGTRLGLIWAIMEAGHRRLRPIVMTSLTTILALVPFLNKGSMGADIQYPMSLALTIGMTAGTAVSLFFVPMLYYIIYRKKRNKRL